jgi:3-phytase
MRVRYIAMTAAALVACAPSPERAAESAADESVTVKPTVATPALARGAAADVAFWPHPSDPARSLVLGSAGLEGLQAYALDGQRAGGVDDIETTLVEVIDGFELETDVRPLVVVLDSSAATLLAYVVDPATLAFAPASARPLEVGDQATGLCGYTSSLTHEHHVFVVTESGAIQQWHLHAQGSQVDGQLVRTLGAGSGSGYCVADEPAGTLYYSEETVGVWKVDAEPETEATRVPVDLAAPFGRLGDETKGLAVDPTGEHLIVSDVANRRLHLYSTADGTRSASLALDDIEEAEGIALGLQAYGGGWLAVADERDSGSSFKLVSWDSASRTLGLPAARAAQPPAAQLFVRPSVETAPVESWGDAADDPAIWVHPTDPALSLVIGTQKKRGLHVYDLQGRDLQTLPDGRMNNIDLRYDFPFRDGAAAIVVATNRSTDSLAIYRVDASQRRLVAAGGAPIATGFADPYGLCMYRARGGDYYVFANDSNGLVKQWRLQASEGGVAGEVVREFEVGSQAEGCAADDDLGQLYVNEEDVGLWKYSAAPEGGSERTLIDRVDEGHLEADVEGVAIYYGENGTGYVIVSNQGEDDYAVYRREGANEYVGQFHVVADATLGIDGVSETDGLDVTSAALGPAFARGLLVVQDGRNMAPRERQNFKLVSWENVATALRLEGAAD